MEPSSPFFSFEDVVIAKPPPQQTPPQKQPSSSKQPQQAPKPLIREHSVKEQEIQELKASYRKQALKVMAKFMGKKKCTNELLRNASRAIQRVVEDSTPKNVAELDVKKKIVKKVILEALKKIEGIPECKLVFYGSTENGFWQGKASDIDCSIVMADPHQRVKTADVQDILNGLQHYFKGTVKAGFIRASNLSFLKCSMPFLFDGVKKDLQFDINVGSVLGNYNSELVKTYVDLEPLYLKAGHYLKYWSKTKVRKQHNFDQTQTLSSYALLMMLLVFLQSRFELLPRLQQIPDTPDSSTKKIIHVLDQRNKKGKPRPFNQYFQANVHFCSNKDTMQKYIFCDEELNTARILIEFFFFYAFVFDPDKMVINVPEGAFTQKQKYANKDEQKRDIPFTIIDPFDPHHNPGKTIRKSSMKYKVTLEEMIKAFFELTDTPMNNLIND